MSDQAAQKSWLERLSQALASEPSSRSELIDLLRASQERELIDVDALKIIEGALTVADKQVREIMIPRSQVVFIKADQKPSEFLPVVIGSGHSRFPVILENKDEIVGILLAKDLLKYLAKKNGSFDIEKVIRPSVIIPETKKLNVLLSEFKSGRNHLAVVVDEYGGVSGLITIEDVLEQIVGDIIDEHDVEENQLWLEERPGVYLVHARLELDDFFEQTGVDLKDHETEEEYDTIGGLVSSLTNRIPVRGEVVRDKFNNEYSVVDADPRSIKRLRVFLARQKLKNE